MVLLAVSQAGIAIAPTFAWVVVLRGCSALFHGAVWASAPTVANALLPGRPGRATATVFVGSALGNVLGAPLVAALSAVATWRAASLVLALLALVCALTLLLSIPVGLPGARADGTPGTRPGRGCVLAVARWCVIVVLVASAHLTTFTFLGERAARSGLTGGGLSALLLAMGVAGLAGTLVMARAHDARPRASTLAALFALAVSLLVVGLGAGPVRLFAAVIVWGAAYSGLTVALQAFVLRDAAGWAQLASSWYVLFFQVGIAAGSGLGAGLLARTQSPQVLALVSAGIAGGALAMAIVLTRTRGCARPTAR